MSATVKKYIEAIGRRKTSTARVRIEKATKMSFIVNKKPLDEYFKTAILRQTLHDPFEKAKVDQHFFVSVLVSGGGSNSQAQAIRHGISRALTKHDEEFRGPLKKLGFLKRDPRVKERRKFGLKKARKSPQWSKR